MIPISAALILGAVILIIGIIADEIHSRFGIPDILMMIFLGSLFGPILKVIPRDPLMMIAPYLAAVTLAIVLFEGGINFPAQKGLTEAFRALLYAFIGVSFSVIIAVPFSFTVYSWSPLIGALLGAIVGGTSSAVVLSLMPRMNISQEAKNVLSLESIFTDAIVIVIAMLIMRLVTLPSQTITIETVSREIMGCIMISLLVGFLLAVALSKIIATLQMKMYGDIFLLAIVILVYGITEQVGGSGALTVFVFALTIANIRQLIPRMRVEAPSLAKRIKDKIPSFRPYSRKFYTQIAFLMRTYFFAFLGMIFSIPSIHGFLAGLALTGCLILMRYLATLIITYKSNISSRDRIYMTLICGRGLAAAVLSSLLLTYGIAASPTIQDLVTQVIIYTTIISAISSYLSKSGLTTYLKKGGI
ncbi:MAG: hypothetical protein DRN49_04100 [Thaumarchaeota archaeon]|nr:MAG: hypothetical protein DRN49_04100 [Nitrososphaerota archaeon]